MRPLKSLDVSLSAPRMRKRVRNPLPVGVEASCANVGQHGRQCEDQIWGRAVVERISRGTAGTHCPIWLCEALAPTPVCHFFPIWPQDKGGAGSALQVGAHVLPTVAGRRHHIVEENGRKREKTAAWELSGRDGHGRRARGLEELPVPVARLRPKTRGELIVHSMAKDIGRETVRNWLSGAPLDVMQRMASHVS